MATLDINRFLKVLFNNKLYITLILIVFVAIGYLYSFYYVTPMYKSFATIVLVQNDNLEPTDNIDSITQNDITLNQNLLSTYTKIAKSNKVLEQVIHNLGLNISTQSLSSLISIQAISNTEVFKISVSNTNNILAAKIANELVSVFSKEIQDLYNMNNVYIMDFAEVSYSPYNINHIKDICISLGIGLIVAFGLITIIYFFDNTIKSEKDIEDYTGLSVLSTIPVYGNKKNKNFNELIVKEFPKSPISECFKTFRTNVMFSIQNKQLNTILVTSSLMGEGKSFIAANLAIAFAESGKKVVLVDTDMRKGRIHKIFGLPHQNGLSNCLANITKKGNSVNINTYINKTDIPNLHIITSGNVPPNPSELLSSSYMKKFLEALNSQYDVVICDGTPCMLVSDSIILSKIVDTTVLVTAYRSTKLDNLIKIKKSIEIVDGNIGGAVINKMAINAKSYKNTYYYGHINEIDNKIDIKPDDKILDNVPCINEVALENSPVYDEYNTTPDNIVMQDDYVSSLSNIIQNNSKEITELKGLYKNTIVPALETINKTEITSDIIDELSKLKDMYIDNITLQNEQISNLNDRISNIKLEDNSTSVINEIKDIKDYYTSSIEAQNEQISSLNDKISNIKLEDNSNSVIDEIKSIREYYKSSIETQNKQIAELNNKLSNIKSTDNDELLTTVSSIYEQLENILSRFDVLEEKSKHNEIIAKKLNKTAKINPVIGNRFDVKKLNDKVIKIQDYLENEYNIEEMSINSDIIEEPNNDNQVDIINNSMDNSIEEVEPENLSNESILTENTASIHDEVKSNMDSVKPKHKRGFALFNFRKAKLDSDIEEDIEIVSQILCGNTSKEYVS